jgi:hypothetical protein
MKAAQVAKLAFGAALTLAVPLVLTVSSCRGKPVIAAELTGPGAATARFTARAGQTYAIWADTEGSWIGGKRSRFPAEYTIAVEQGGKSLGKLSCDTRSSNLTVCGVDATCGNEKSADCEYMLNCALPPLAPGEVVLKVEGRIADPKRVTKVKKMSIVVREK